MKKVLLSVALLWLIVPQLALAQTYLVMERGTTSLDPIAASANLGLPPAPGSTLTYGLSPFGVVFPNVVVIPGTSQGAPSEPIGCMNTIQGQTCWAGTSPAFPANTNGSYGWPKLSVVPDAAWPNDNYIVEGNFWNDEAALGDKTLYPAGKIFMPGMGSTAGGRFAYPTASTQFVIPSGWPDSAPYTDCSGSQCFPQAPFVSGKLEVAVNSTATPYVFGVTASSIVSRNADGTLIDERYYPAAYPTILKGCHTTNCTANTGAPFPIQIQDLGKIPSTWNVSITGAAAHRPTPTTPTDFGGVYDVAYDIWLDIGRRPGDCVPATPGQPLPQHRQCFYYPWAPGQKATEMPLANQFVMQPYGTEIMIWLGYYDGSGRTAGETGGQVQPAGSKIATATIGGYDWDIWVGYGRDITDTGLYWNVVSFIRPQNPTTGWDNFATSLSFTDPSGQPLDTAQFIEWVWKNMGGTAAGQALGCPIAYSADNASNPPTANTNACAAPDWWLTDIDAGFEIWDRGEGLQTTAFSVRPTFKDVVSSERVLESDPSTKVFNWQKYIQLFRNQACGGQMYYDIHSDESFDWSLTNPGNWGWCSATQNGGGRWYSDTQFNTSVNAIPTKACATPSTRVPSAAAQAMVKLYPDPDGLGGTDWYAVVAPVYSHGMHGPMQIHFYCDAAEVGTPVNIYIDPSGRAMASDPDGTATSPLYNATVTLLKYDPTTATWPEVTNGDTAVMDPMLNTKNSDWTAYDGAFGWNVAPGTYKVQASMEGCHAVGNPSQPFTETGDLVVAANPIVGLELLLDCSEATGPGPTRPTGNLEVTLSIFSNWTSGGPNGTGGYCATVNGTNNTGTELDWTTAFTLPEAGTIYDNWNGEFAQSGSSVTVSGADWNNTLEPGQSLQDVGFCVDRGASSTPSTHGLAVSKAGSGSGTVTSSPAGINCGSDCNEDYATGTTVTLTATPASGSVFAGWGGACSGTGACTVAMSSDRSITATFNLGTGGVTVTPVINQNTIWFTEEALKIGNTGSLTALTITMNIQKTTGISYNGQYNTVGSQIQQSHNATSSPMTYTFNLASGQTLAAGSDRIFAAQANGTGKVHPTSGDTYTVTYATGGITYTQTGHF